MILSKDVENKINNFLGLGYGLRIDVGLSYNAPYLFEWIKTNSKIIVLGFEPNHESFLKVYSELMKLPEGIRSRAFIFNFAIDDVTSLEIKDFFVTGNYNTEFDPGNSSLHKPIGLFKDLIVRIDKVKVISLFDVLNGINFHIIEFLKIDTQGNDLSVLKSLKEFNSKLFLVQAERDCTNWYEDSHSGLELDTYMKLQGFHRLGLGERNQMDSLYLNKGIKSINFVSFKLFDLLMADYRLPIRSMVRGPIKHLVVLINWCKFKLVKNLKLQFMKLKHLIKWFVLLNFLR